jgi:hypothetical protein
MQKNIYSAIILLSLSIMVYYIANWYLNIVKNGNITHNIISVSKAINDGKFDEMDQYFTEDFELQLEGSKYSLAHVKNNLSFSKDMLPEIQIDSASWINDGSNINVNAIAWTRLWEVDFQIFMRKYSIFDYRINKIEPLEVGQKMLISSKSYLLIIQ